MVKYEFYISKLSCYIERFKQIFVAPYFLSTFLLGGKKCPSCGQRVYHDKWGLSDKLAEARWAHQQARSRELAEVEDFFN